MATTWAIASTLFLYVVFANYNKNIMEYKAIDLGLPSGRLWADKNVGAEKETDYGRYFQWGDTVGYNDASHSNWENCPGNDEKSMERWDGENLNIVTGMEDSTKILKPEVDAATVNMGSEWRMPTIEDCTELMNNTNYEVAEINGVKGEKFIHKNDPSKYIFLPFAGFAADGSFGGQGVGGDVWISSVYSDDPECAYYMGAYEFDYGDYVGNRFYAFPIRGVC